MRGRAFLSAAFLALVPFLAVDAERVVMSDGHVWEGEVLDRTASQLRIRLDSGIRLTLPLDRVDRIEPFPSPLERYEIRLEEADLDDPAEHVALAAWCLGVRLRAPAAAHLRVAVANAPWETVEAVLPLCATIEPTPEGRARTRRIVEERFPERADRIAELFGSPEEGTEPVGDPYEGRGLARWETDRMTGNWREERGILVGSGEGTFHLPYDASLPTRYRLSLDVRRVHGGLDSWIGIYVGSPDRILAVRLPSLPDWTRLEIRCGGTEARPLHALSLDGRPVPDRSAEVRVESLEMLRGRPWGLVASDGRVEIRWVGIEPID